MKYLEVWLRLPDRLCHPMQAFIRHDDAPWYEELRAWNLDGASDGEHVLFYVEGDRERYRDALEGIDTIREYAIAPIDADAFHVSVREETRPETTAWRGAFAELDLVVVPPIRFDEQGKMGLTLVGDGDDVARFLEELPDEIAVTVDEIGTYDRRGGTLAGALSERQLEAVAVAVDAGYYDVPRTASLSAVADELGIAESSASLLLRRAERAVLSRLLDRRGETPRSAAVGE